MKCPWTENSNCRAVQLFPVTNRPGGGGAANVAGYVGREQVGPASIERYSNDPEKRCGEHLAVMYSVAALTQGFTTVEQGYVVHSHRGRTAELNISWWCSE